MEVDASILSGCKRTHIHCELSGKRDAQVIEDSFYSFFVAFPANLSRMHGAGMLYQILLPPTSVSALMARDWLIVIMAKHMSLQCPFSFKFRTAFLTYMVVIGMLFAHVQVEGTDRLEF